MAQPDGKLSIAVLGAGAWGATLADLLAQAGHAVSLWDASAAALARLSAERCPPGVPELRLDPSVRLSDSLAEAVAGTDAAVFVVPSQAVGELSASIAALDPGVRPGAVVLASKGIDLVSLRPLADVVASHLPLPVAVVSGPCIAREVAQRVPTSVVVASTDDGLCARLQVAFHTPWFRVYRQRDILGVELGGALKNVVAIAAGVADGMGFGNNSKSALLTRGLAEMSRLAVALGAEERTLAGLSGLGDLMVTSFSPWSRNRRFGELIARGKTRDEAIAEIGMVVEGVPTAAAAVSLARRHSVEAPVMTVVDDLCRGSVAPREALASLMTRSLKNEF